MAARSFNCATCNNFTANAGGRPEDGLCSYWPQFNQQQVPAPTYPVNGVTTWCNAWTVIVP